MKETELDRHANFDSALFSPEELAMMGAANGAINNPDIRPDLAELQAQYVALAKLVAEGGERERQLRALINNLTMLAKTSEEQHRSIYAQTQTLAQIVIASSERELQMQKSLETLRNLALTRAKHVT